MADLLINELEDMITCARRQARKRLVVAIAQENSVISSVKAAYQAGLIAPVLVGDKKKIVPLAKKFGLSMSKIEIINEPDPDKAVCKAVELVTKADILMKGMVSTKSLIHVLLTKQAGLRKESILSHIAIFKLPQFNRIMFLTDAGINIKPNLYRKIEIVENVIKVAHKLGVKMPRVAMLAAVEKIDYPAMPATLDAHLIAEMNRKGKIKDAVIDGPFALDNAVSVEAAQLKKLAGPVAGQADILCVPDIESGNILYKSLVWFVKADIAGIVAGAEAPIVVPSRADTEKSKLLSIAASIIISQER